MRRFFYPSYRSMYVAQYDNYLVPTDLSDDDPETGIGFQALPQSETEDDFNGDGTLEDHVSADGHTWSKLSGFIELDGSGNLVTTEYGGGTYLWVDDDLNSGYQIKNYRHTVYCSYSSEIPGVISLRMFQNPMNYPTAGMTASVGRYWNENLGIYEWRWYCYGGNLYGNEPPGSQGTLAGPPSKIALTYPQCNLYLDDVYVGTVGGIINSGGLSKIGLQLSGLVGSLTVSKQEVAFDLLPHYAWGSWAVDIGPSNRRVFFDNFTDDDDYALRYHQPDYDPSNYGWGQDTYSPMMTHIVGNRAVTSVETFRGYGNGAKDSVVYCGYNHTNQRDISATIGVMTLPGDLLTSAIVFGSFEWYDHYQFYGARWRYEPGDQTGHWDIVLASVVNDLWTYAILATTPGSLAPGDTRLLTLKIRPGRQALCVDGVEILTSTDNTIDNADYLYPGIAFQNCSPTTGLYIDNFVVEDPTIELAEPISTVTGILRYNGTLDAERPFILECSDGIIDENGDWIWTEPEGIEYPTLVSVTEQTDLPISIDLPGAPRTERYWRISYSIKEEADPYLVALATMSELMTELPEPPAPTPIVYEDCGAFLGVRECEVRIYDTLGKRKFLGMDDWLESVDWEMLERGGYGSGTLKLKAEWEEVRFEGNERVDVYLFDQLAYRGYVRTSENDLAEEDTVTVNMYGLMELMEHWYVYRKFAYGTPTDISIVFRDILNHAVKIDGRLEDIVVTYEEIGCYVQEFDAIGKSVTQAINQLCDLAPNQVIWGAEVHNVANWRGYRESVLYMRIKSTALTHAFAIGKNVTGYTYPVDVGEVVNRIRLTGGKVRQPNLMPNGGFEKLLPAGEEAANFLTAHSFELEDDEWGDWVASDGVTIQHAGQGGEFGSGRTGANWLEIDRNGEAAYQDVSIPVGQRVTISCWARLEQSSQSNSFVLQLTGFSEEGDILSDQTLGSTLEGATHGTLYWKYQIDADYLFWSGVCRVRFKVIAQAGSANNDGILIDDCAVIPFEGVGQEDWRFHPTGDAKIWMLNWNEYDSPRNGGLYVAAQMRNINSNSDTGEFYMYQSKSPSVKPNERYTMIVSWKVAVDSGGDNIGIETDNALSFGCVDIHSDNTQHTVTESITFIGNPTTWRTDYVEIITDGDTAKLQPFIRLRTERLVCIDSVMLVQGDPPDEVMNHGSFWSGEEYETVIDVTDPEITGLSDDARTSIDDYGIREAILTQEAVIDRASLLTYARDYFNAHALPTVNGKLSVLGPTALLPMDGLVRLIGIADGPNDLFPSRIRYTVSDSVKLEADLGNERPDMADLLFIMKDRAERGY